MNPNRIHRHDSTAANSRVSCISIFWTFFRIGLFTLGGGLAMVAVMRHELVLKRRWVEDDDFMAEMSIATVVPGAIAVNIAYLQGRRLRGGLGAAAAVFGAILPSFCTIVLIAMFALPYLDQPRVAAFLRGCAIAVAGQLAFAGFTFGKRLFRNWCNVFVCSVGLFIVAVLRMHPIWAVIIVSGLAYLLCYTILPRIRSNTKNRKPDGSIL